MTEMPPLGSYNDLSNPANRPGYQRPSTAELAGLQTNRRGTVRASARAGSKAHLTELTEPQLRVLWAADNPAGLVSQNGSTGVTRPLIRALAAKGYGTAQYDMQRRHLIIGFEINERGRRAARERFGMPKWMAPEAASAIEGAERLLTKLTERTDRDDLVHPFAD